MNFPPSGEVQGVIQAARAEVRPDGTWLLESVSRKRFSGTRIDTEQLATLVWHSFLRPAQVSLLTLPAESMRPLDLYRYVRDLERRHQPAARYAQELWEKMDLPLAMAAMILIAVPFAFGSLRTRGMGQRMMIGTMIGIIFTLVQQITSYLGLLLNVSPVLTATMPSIVLVALGVYLFRRAVWASVRAARQPDELGGCPAGSAGAAPQHAPLPLETHAASCSGKVSPRAVAPSSVDGPYRVNGKGSPETYGAGSDSAGPLGRAVLSATRGP